MQLIGFGFLPTFSDKKEIKLKGEQNKMMEVVIVAVAATLGNLLVGWDSSTIAGWFIYLFYRFMLCYLIMLYISSALLQLYICVCTYQKISRSCSCMIIDSGRSFFVIFFWSFDLIYEIEKLTVILKSCICKTVYANTFPNTA